MSFLDRTLIDTKLCCDYLLHQYEVFVLETVDSSELFRDKSLGTVNRNCFYESDIPSVIAQAANLYECDQFLNVKQKIVSEIENSAERNLRKEAAQYEQIYHSREQRMRKDLENELKNNEFIISLVSKQLSDHRVQFRCKMDSSALLEQVCFSNYTNLYEHHSLAMETLHAQQEAQDVSWRKMDLHSHSAVVAHMQTLQSQSDSESCARRIAAHEGSLKRLRRYGDALLNLNSEYLAPSMTTGDTFADAVATHRMRRKALSRRLKTRQMQSQESLDATEMMMHRRLEEGYVALLMELATQMELLFAHRTRLAFEERRLSCGGGLRIGSRVADLCRANGLCSADTLGVLLRLTGKLPG